MLINKKIAIILRELNFGWSNPSNIFVDECGYIHDTIHEEIFNNIKLYQFDLNEYERENEVVGKCYLLYQIGDIIDWLSSEYNIHVEVFINEEYNDYCCRCWDVSKDQKVLLNTRVAYSNTYDAWMGILESTLKYIINNK